MTMTWTSEDVGFHTAECVLGAGVVVHLLVESLGEHGWNWQVWDPVECLKAHCGLADTLEAAMVHAELALFEAMDHAGQVLLEVVAALF